MPMPVLMPVPMPMRINMPVPTPVPMLMPMPMAMPVPMHMRSCTMASGGLSIGIGCKAEKVQFFFIPILDLTVSGPKGPKIGATGIFFVQIVCVYDQFLYVKLFHKNFGPTDTYNGQVEIITTMKHV